MRCNGCPYAMSITCTGILIDNSRLDNHCMYPFIHSYVCHSHVDERSVSTIVKRHCQVGVHSLVSIGIGTGIGIIIIVTIVIGIITIAVMIRYTPVSL